MSETNNVTISGAILKQEENGDIVVLVELDGKRCEIMRMLGSGRPRNHYVNASGIKVAMRLADITPREDVGVDRDVRP